MTDQTKQDLAVALRHYRERKHLTQKELAQLCGITQTTVSEIENGKANPTLDVLLKLAEAVGVPVIGLLGAGAVVGALGSLLAPPVIGAVVGALLSNNRQGGYEGWVANKLVEGLTEVSDKRS